MNIKNVCKKIEIHPFFYVVSFFVLITGNFKYFTLFMVLLMVHECGHILVARYFKWNIEKLKLYPFGALTEFQENINKPIREEFLIALAGPIFQTLFYIACPNWEVLKEFHYGILWFNLLPIYPLDGFKMVVLLYQRFFSYWGSIYFETYLSLITILILCFQVEFSLVWLLIFLTLVMGIIENFKLKKVRFQKFLLERFLYRFSFPRRKIIKNENLTNMRRDTKHLFLKNGNYVTEEHYLKNLFDFNGKA